MHGLVDDEQKETLAAAVPEGDVDNHPAVRPRASSDFRSHGSDHDVTAEVRMDYTIRTPKADVYGGLIRGVMQDLVDAIRIGKPTLVTLEDTVEAVKMGEAANRIADGL